jgi:hypothetical protein
LSGWHVDVPEMDTNKAAINPFIVRKGLLVSLALRDARLLIRCIKIFGLVSNTALPACRELRGCWCLPLHQSAYKMFPKSVEVQMMHRCRRFLVHCRRH